MSCEGCKYWSWLVAQSIGGNPVEALCLDDNQANPNSGKYAHLGCEHKVEGAPVDSPDAAAEELCPHDCDHRGQICDPDNCVHWQEERCNGLNNPPAQEPETESEGRVEEYYWHR